MNNSTIFTADRTTHLKVVVIALVASVAIIVVGIAARTTTPADATAHIQTAGPAVKAGKAIAGNDGVNFAEFKDITNFSEWARIEDTYGRAGRGTA